MSARVLVATLLLAALLPGCARTDRPNTDVRTDSRARAEARPAEAVEEISGDPCTENCSGSEAGYDWAEQKGIVDPNDCGGNSDSFIEGCMAYVQEQREDRDTGSD
jgi:hypothetical protein